MMLGKYLPNFYVKRNIQKLSVILSNKAGKKSKYFEKKKDFYLYFLQN